MKVILCKNMQKAVLKTGVHSKDHITLSTSKDDEFKISLSLEDIDKIDEEIRNVEKNSKKSIEKSKMTKDEFS